MPNTEELKRRINDSGMTVMAISEKTGINRATIYNRLNGRGEWMASEIVRISDVLRLTPEEKVQIFLQ